MRKSNRKRNCKPVIDLSHYREQMCWNTLATRVGKGGGTCPLYGLYTLFLQISPQIRENSVLYFASINFRDFKKKKVNKSVFNFVVLPSLLFNRGCRWDLLLGVIVPYIFLLLSVKQPDFLLLTVIYEIAVSVTTHSRYEITTKNYRSDVTDEVAIKMRKKGYFLDLCVNFYSFIYFNCFSEFVTFSC